MKVFIVALIVLFGYADAIAVKSSTKRSQAGYTQEEIDGYQGYDDLKVSTVASLEIDNNGYSSGSGLRSIAQGSAHQANSAVEKQHAAALQAAYLVQTTLAQSAIQAAATANAALAGKEVLLDNLEKESLVAISNLDGEVSQLESAKKAADQAKVSSLQSISHVATLTAALNSAQQFAEKAELASREADAQLASQTAMVGKAKGRFDSVANKLTAAQIDFEATKEAAAKATAAAEEAQNNAALAGVHASAKLHEFAGATQSSHLLAAA